MDKLFSTISKIALAYIIYNLLCGKKDEKGFKDLNIDPSILEDFLRKKNEVN